MKTVNTQVNRSEFNSHNKSFNLLNGLFFDARGLNKFTYLMLVEIRIL
jgi:hypothetical protein